MNHSVDETHANEEKEEEPIKYQNNNKDTEKVRRSEWCGIYMNDDNSTNKNDHFFKSLCEPGMG